MPKNKIEDLRNHLFVNSAKIEVDFIRATGREMGTGFIPEERKLIG